MSEFIELHWKSKNNLTPQMTMIPLSKLNAFKEKLKENEDVEWYKDENEMEGKEPIELEHPDNSNEISDEELERVNSDKG